MKSVKKFPLNTNAYSLKIVSIIKGNERSFVEVDFWRNKAWSITARYHKIKYYVST
jgi:predicted nucleic acid-binding OB-fold protein